MVLIIVQYHFRINFSGLDKRVVFKISPGNKYTECFVGVGSYLHNTCTHKHTQTYTRAHAHTHTQTHTYTLHTSTHTHTHTRIFTQKHVHIHAHTHTLTRTDTRTHAYACIHTLTHTRTRTRTHTCMLAHRYTHTHTHTHTYTTSRFLRKGDLNYIPTSAVAHPPILTIGIEGVSVGGTRVAQLSEVGDQLGRGTVVQDVTS